MKIVIDTDTGSLEVDGGVSQPLYSHDSLEILSKLWIQVEWNELHWKSFSWLGLPMWQLPEDVLRLQEFVWEFKPDIIVETGINLGGSALFFASMCKLMGKGEVISIDISIPAEVRSAIERHTLSDAITLVEGDSVSDDTVAEVKALAGSNDKVLVFLDSDHSYAHVLKELERYSELLPLGSYIVATDGVMEFLADVPLGSREWIGDNPMTAAKEFVSSNPNFVIERPKARYHDEKVIQSMSYWPSAWIKRVK